MKSLEITHDFNLPVGRVYAYLSEHENLGPLFGATVTRVRDGDTTRNGVGSVRRLRVAVLPPFEETVTEAVPDERVVYRISKGMPLLNNHKGVMTFSSTPAGTSTPAGSRLHYVIAFRSVVPGLDRLLMRSLDRSVRKGLAAVDARA